MAKDNKNTEPKETLESTETLLSEKEMYLLDKEEKLSEKEETLLEKEAELTQKETELNEKKAVLEAYEKALETEETSPSVLPKRQAVVFSFRGEKYQFADDAPSHILFEGRSFSQEDIIKEEDALVILIGGNSSLIEKV